MSRLSTLDAPEGRDAAACHRSGVAEQDREARQRAIGRVLHQQPVAVVPLTGPSRREPGPQRHTVIDSYRFCAGIPDNRHTGYQ